MKRFILAGFMLACKLLMAQGEFTLEACQQAASKNYPLIHNQQFYEQSFQLTQNALKSGYLPNLALGGQASWQSTVTALPISFPGISIPETAKDQYKLNLDASQLIFDGGLTQVNKQLASVQLATDMNDLETELYKLRQRINELYLNANLLQKQIAISQTMQHSLEARLKVCQSALANGTTTTAQCEALKAEILQLKQRTAESESARKAVAKMLSIYTGLEISEQMIAEIPDVTPLQSNTMISRPDFMAFDLLHTKATLNAKLINTAKLPKVTGFAQAGYGRPGLNMLSSDFDSYFIVGIRFNWMLWNWKQTSNQSKVAELKANTIENAKETFAMNIKLQLAAKQTEIEKFQDLLASDNELIETRKKISTEASSQFDNGVLSSADLVQRLNEEATAKLNAEVHKLQLKYAKIMLNEILGSNN